MYVFSPTIAFFVFPTLHQKQLSSSNCVVLNHPHAFLFPARLLGMQ